MMKYSNYIPSLLVVFLAACSNSHNPKKGNTRGGQELIFPKGDKITNGNFTGNAYLQLLVPADSLNATSVGNVTFEPGARTKWHSHPGGQILLATAGVGYYQEKGQPKKILRKGDVLKCQPNVIHWHGASIDSAFVQLAITNTQNGIPVWLNEVTDEEYRKN